MIPVEIAMHIAPIENPIRAKVDGLTLLLFASVNINIALIIDAITDNVV